MAKHSKKTPPRQSKAARKAAPPPAGTAAIVAGQPLPDLPAVAGPAIDGWRVVNRVQLAALLGVHPDTVTDYAGQGMPVSTRGGYGREGEYDSVACLDWWRLNAGKQNAKDAAITRQADSRARINEQQLAERRGELVEREAVVLAGKSFVKSLSATVRGIPRRLVQAGIIGRQQEAAAAGECRDILDEISKWKTLRDLKRGK